MPHDLGSTVAVSWTTTASHTVTLAVTLPDGSALDPAPTVTENAGTYSADVVGTLAGRYLLTWTDTTDTVKHTDTIEVWPADPRFLISFEDATQSLGWRAADTAANGAQLRLYIAAATPIIEDIAGAVLVRTVEQFADGGRRGIALWHRPDEVTAVEVDGVEITDYVPNLNAGIVYRGRYGEMFDPGRQIVKITYTVGAAQVQPNIQLGTKELVRHLWQIGQQITSGVPVDYGQTPMGLTPSGFAVPKRVIELCSTSYTLPGIA